MATTKKAAVAVQQSPEVAAVNAEGSKILAFVTSLVTFLTRARELEVRANETLEAARAIKPVKDAAGDLAVKEFVRRANADRKELEDHWSITTVIHAFHKRLTAARNRALLPLETAVGIGTRLHTDYVEAEARRVREEQERKRREEEERAAEERRRELEELERQALAAEESSEELSEREQVFVDAYVRNGGRGVEAARAAGYKDAFKQSARLLTFTKILKAIEGKQQAEAIRQQKDAVASLPLETKAVEVTSRADTSGDRKTKSAVVFDEGAFIAAVLEGKLGIPTDCLTIRQTKLNEYARSFGKIINSWPGVRYEEKTTVI